MAIDRQALKKQAEEKKNAAKQLAQVARRNAEVSKKLSKNPPPVMIEQSDITGDIEKDCEIELTDLQKGFRQRAKEESKRFEQATDSEYWAAICFQSREQKETFLAALDVLKYGDKYIDGQELAKALNIQLPEANIPFNTSQKKDKTWIELTE